MTTVLIPARGLRARLLEERPEEDPLLPALGAEASASRPAAGPGTLVVAPGRGGTPSTGGPSPLQAALRQAGAQPASLIAPAGAAPTGGGLSALAGLTASGLRTDAVVNFLATPVILGPGVEPGLIGAEEAFAGASTLGTGTVTIGDLAAGAGALLNVGTGLFNLVEGHTVQGAATLGGTAVGAGIGFAVGGPPGALLGAALGGGGGSLLGGLFGGKGGGHRRDIRALSRQEGEAGLSAFQAAAARAESLPALVDVLNQPWAKHAGQFQVYGTEPGGAPFALRNYDAGPGTRRFTLADLRNPAIVATLGVQAGELGAPAEQPAVATALRARIQALGGGGRPGVDPGPAAFRVPAFQAALGLLGLRLTA